MAFVAGVREAGVPLTWRRGFSRRTRRGNFRIDHVKGALTPAATPTSA